MASVQSVRLADAGRKRIPPIRRPGNGEGRQGLPEPDEEEKVYTCDSDGSNATLLTNIAQLAASASNKDNK
jgi:hypothetical protein